MMPKLLAFRDCLETKEQALIRIAGYSASDNRPCSILFLIDPFIPDDAEHVLAAVEAAHGIPRSLAALQHRILHGLPKKKAALWTQRFYDAIPEGADLSAVFIRFVNWALTDPAAMRKGADNLTLNALDTVAALYKRKLCGGDVNATEWWDASRVALDVWHSKAVRTGKAGDDAGSSQAAEFAALLQYYIERGMGSEAIAEAEDRVMTRVLDVFPWKTRGKTWTGPLYQHAADALVNIVVTCPLPD